MTRIHVCPLHLVPAQSAQLQPSALITLLSPAGQMPERPHDLPHDRHLTRLFHDIAGPADGLTPPSERDVAAVIAFGRTWDRRSPLLIHCYAGISRSTAARASALAVPSTYSPAEALRSSASRGVMTSTPSARSGRAGSTT